MTRLMTTPAATRTTPVDLRSKTRLLAAILLPVGPAAIALLRFVMPYETTDSSTTIVHEVAAHQTAQAAVVWLGFIASLTLVPAVLSAGRVARREAPRLTAAALLLLVPAYLSIGWLVASDAAVLFAVRHGLSTEDAAASYDALHPAVLVAGGIFVAGHVLGTVLLGCALWRVQGFPRWAALAVAISQPLHFVAAVILASHSLDLVAWGLNSVGFAVVGITILRMSDEQWAPTYAPTPSPNR
jgi:hypothetical protein